MKSYLIFGLIELSWNIFPSNAISSSIFNACNLIVLIGLWRTIRDSDLKLKICSTD